MKAVVLVASALMLACFTSSAQAAAPKAPEKSWFVPQLTAGDPAECAPLLIGARKAFFGEGRDYYPDPLGTDVPGLNIIPYDVEDQGTRPASIKGFTLKMDTVIGCGMACDTGKITVFANGRAVFTTPEANPWAEYADGKDRDYLVAIVERHAEAYRVANSGKPALACRIAMEPDFEKLTNSDALAALEAVDSLNQASLGMSRAGGTFCGSMATAARWEINVAESLRKVLYRPWALASWTSTTGQDSFGDYSKILPDLTLWSLGGFSEHASFQLYKDRIAATEKILTNFFVKRFGWNTALAHSMARSALRNAVSSGYGFATNNPDEEARLRSALFAHAPMAEIRAIPLDVRKLEGLLDPQSPDTQKDSLLNVAIAYPEALQYFLDKGFDPNRANSFGKTPLMYAAQYNQLEAARLLLKAGADPNARTTRPPYDCGFMLATTSMTPLHYAARNAGPALIRLLLQSGAVTYIKARREDGLKDREDAPIDWLRLYTKSDPGKERNPNLTAEETSALEKELAPPNPPAMAKVAVAQVLLGEKQSIAGDNEGAYRAIALALQADPDNQKALADLPLLAFKTGRPGEAAQAATHATTALKSDADKASAWFNLGLVCQKNTKSLVFDGENYCQSDFIEPFLRAWQLAPNESRTNKLVQMMERDAVPNAADFCKVQGRAYRVMFAGRAGEYTARVYVLHPAGETVDPDSIGWTMNWADKPTTFLSPIFSKRHNLGSQDLTLLESPQWSPPLMVNGQECALPPR